MSAGHDISVNAVTSNYLVSLAQAGSKAASLGITGALIFVDLNNTTLGYIEDGAIINAGNDVNVTATNSFYDIVGTGGTATGGSIGIGFSGSYNNLNNTTKAFIGDNNGDTGSPGSVTAGDAVTVTATSSENVYAIGISGAYSSGLTPPSSDPLDGVSLPALFEEQPAVSGQAAGSTGDPASSASKQFGIGLSGDIALNFLDDDTEAYIAQTGSVHAGGEVNVAATDTSMFVAVAGAAAFGSSTGIGGSFSLDYLTKTTLAYIQGTSVNAGDVVIDASAPMTIISVVGGATGSKSSASVAGSVNVNFLTGETEAYLGSGTTVTTNSGGVSIDASATLTTATVAGVISVTSSGSAAVGAVLDLGIYQNTVLAFVAASDQVTAAGNVAVESSLSDSFLSIGAALAASASSGTGADGSASAQDITDEV